MYHDIHDHDSGRHFIQGVYKITQKEGPLKLQG
jgi:hypothetical protein